MNLVKKFISIFLMVCVAMFSTVSLQGAAMGAFENNLLENTPIDVVYKYIDLRDKNLVRDGIPQIIKDYDNEELRYSIRSVLQNIPWVRKIFIIMPNEKVSFLKEPDEISDKIVYIRDKDLLGFDSASSITFEHNALWKLKRFGVTDNFIYMNDDYFIGKPLSKSDFFYVNNEKKVVPYVLYDGKLLSRNVFNRVEKIYNFMNERIHNNASRQSGFEYRYQTILTHRFLYNVFGRKNLLLPYICCRTIHNATPFNIDDLAEVHSVVANNYEYADECFNAKFRTNRQITFEPLYSFYVLNKYNRKLNPIDMNRIHLRANTSFKTFKSLFCINSGNKAISDLTLTEAKLKMNELFPKRSQYELPEIKNGVYTIETALNSGKVLDIEKAKCDNWANLQLWYKNNSRAQKFRVTYNKNGYYTIKALCSNKFLEVVESNKDNSSNVAQNKRNNAESQQWYIIPTTNGCFNIVAKCNGLCLNVEGANAIDGNNVNCQECDGSNAQKFRFI